MAVERQRGPCVPMSTPSPNTHLRKFTQNNRKKKQHKKEKKKNTTQHSLFLALRGLFTATKTGEQLEETAHGETRQ